MKHLITIILLVGVFISCTIEKRLYNKGFHVEWKKGVVNSENIQGSQSQAIVEKECSTLSDDWEVREPESSIAQFDSVHLDPAQFSSEESTKGAFISNSVEPPSTVNLRSEKAVGKEVSSSKPEYSESKYGFYFSADSYCISTFILGICAFGFSIAFFFTTADLALLFTLMFSIVAIIYGFVSLFKCQSEPGSLVHFALIGMGLACLAGLIFYLTLANKF